MQCKDETKGKNNKANKQDGDYKPKLKNTKEIALLGYEKKRPRRTHYLSAMAKCPKESSNLGGATDSSMKGCDEVNHNFNQEEEKNQGLKKKKNRKRNINDDEFQAQGDTRKQMPRILKKFNRFKKSSQRPMPGGSSDPYSTLPEINQETFIPNPTV